VFCLCALVLRKVKNQCFENFQKKYQKIFGGLASFVLPLQSRFDKKNDDKKVAHHNALNLKQKFFNRM
jgi:hypothetical protein